jgi:hypothetical protein
MSERKIRASRVRLTQPAPDGRGGVTYDWTDGNVADLHFLPDAGLARCTLPNGRKLLATCAHAEVDPAELEAWEAGGEFSCATCGVSFSNAQGLGSHVARKHQTSTGVEVEVMTEERYNALIELGEDHESGVKKSSFIDNSQAGKRRSR